MSSTLRILIVEDSRAEAHLLAMALRKTGRPLEIVIVEDGMKAVEYIKTARGECDLVLLDLNLPRLSGYDVLTEIKRDAELRSLPIVILSGSTDPADIDRCCRAGADSYIAKPVHLDAVFEMAAQLVEYWTARKAAADAKSRGARG